MNEAALYIHIPFCISKCSYCDFFSIPCVKIPESYINRLIEEHEYRQNLYDVKWSTVYVGGGTPSLLPLKSIQKLFSAVLPSCAASAEITFECNPDDVTEELLRVLKESGVTRISLGIQTFCDEKLRYCKRRSTGEINRRALALVQKAGFDHFSADIIAGLPPGHQDEKQLLEDLDEVMLYGTDHISLYSLTLEEGTPLYAEVLNNPLLIDEDLTDNVWIRGRDYLIDRGYYQYEVSNFAKNNARSIHNCSYWNMKSYAGLGAGATGTIFSGQTAVRCTNSHTIDEYVTAPFPQQEEVLVLNKQDCINEYVMMGFRKSDGINPGEFYERFQTDLEKAIEPVFSKWRRRNNALITPSGNAALSKEGLLFLNSFLLEIFQ